MVYHVPLLKVMRTPPKGTLTTGVVKNWSNGQRSLYQDGGTGPTCPLKVISNCFNELDRTTLKLTDPREIMRTIISSNMSSRLLVLICNACGALCQHILEEVEDDFLLAWFKFILIR